MMKRIKSVFLHNMWLKLMSLLLAFVLWFVVVQIDDPSDSVSFNNVPVVLVGTDVLEDTGKVYEVLDNTDKVRVTVRAPRSVTQALKASDIIAEADVQKLTDINTIAITYELASDFTVNSITGNHDVVKLSIDNRASKYISLIAKTMGSVADDYVLGNVTLDQNMIEISGPQQIVDKISYASVDIDVTGATTSLSANLEIGLFDVDGNQITDSAIKKQINYAHISIEVLATKNVTVWSSYTGIPEEGYTATGEINSSMTSVRVAGTPSALAYVSRITISDPVDITGAIGNVEKSVNLTDYMPPGTRLAENDFDGMVTLTVPVEPIIRKTIELGTANIALTGIPEGISARIEPDDTDELTVYISGRQVLIDQVTAENLGAVVDLESWMTENNITNLTQNSVVVPIVLRGDAMNIEGVTIVGELKVRVIIQHNALNDED